jgi:hypothetical protein
MSGAAGAGASGGASTGGASGSAGTSGSSGAGGSSSGPVAIGVYTYTAVPAYNMVNPPAAAWHTGGDYALVENETDTVWRFDPSTKKLTNVASVGTNVVWQDIVFSPDGAHAVLLGNVEATPQGRVYIWDDATQMLAELSAAEFAGGLYQSIAWSPDGTSAKVLAQKSNGAGYIAYVWDFDVTAGTSGVKATATSAGCQDIAWATDSFGMPAPVIVCGVNGAQVMYLDGGGNFVTYNGNIGNTSRIAGRPQGDYALAVGWSGAQLYRFHQGAWDTDFNTSPMLPGIFNVEFSTDGRRALILGGYGSNPPVGQVYEFRDDLFDQADVTDVSVPGFGQPPYNATNGVRLNDAAWRPGCEGGILVGGTDTFSSQSAFVIEFAVENGTACPN